MRPALRYASSDAAAEPTPWHTMWNVSIYGPHSFMVWRSRRPLRGRCDRSCRGPRQTGRHGSVFGVVRRLRGISGCVPYAPGPARGGPRFPPSRRTCGARARARDEVRSFPSMPCGHSRQCRTSCPPASRAHKPAGARRAYAWKRLSRDFARRPLPLLAGSPVRVVVAYHHLVDRPLPTAGRKRGAADEAERIGAFARLFVFLAYTSR